MKRATIYSCASEYLATIGGAWILSWQLLFFYIPLVFVVLLSLSGDSWTDTFLSFFTSVYVRIIARSLVMALGTAITCLAIAYPFAYFLVFRAGRLLNLLLFLVMLPFWTNFLLHICAWFFVLDRQGVLSHALQYLGIMSEPLNILNGVGAIGIMMVYFYLPFMILPLYAALDRFDKRLIEASLDLGASWRQTVIRILLPLTASGIRVGFLLVFIPAFGEFAIPEFMGGDRTLFVGSVITHFILGTESSVAGAAFTLISSAVLVCAVALLYMMIGLCIPKNLDEGVL